MVLGASRFASPGDAFKNKFQPRFEPLFLVFPDEAALPRIGMALSRAYLPDAGLRDLVSLARAGH